ncbi:MAG TPA: glutathione S-transferase [Paracoccaceae bacterium]|nr:glutathione S-transferase [Paracoccaceae bacterium]
MLTLYHAPQSRSSRMIWLLEEFEAEYEIRYVMIPRIDGSGAPDPSNPHPDKKVPALVHDGALVTESIAVATYLNDLHPQSPIAVPVGDPRRGAFLTWLAWYAGVVEPVLAFTWMGIAETEATRRNFRGRAEIDARILKALGEGDYLLGDRFTAPDVIFASMGLWMRNLLPAGASVDRYLESCRGRPALARSEAKEAAPVAA